MTARRNSLVADLIAAYSAGAFPMNDPRTGRISFYDPEPRAILPLTEAEGLHVPRRLERRMRSGRFEITSDQAFGEVVRACSLPRKPAAGSRSVSEETWIDARLAGAYQAMFEAGHAHSVEAWISATGSGQPATGEGGAMALSDVPPMARGSESLDLRGRSGPRLGEPCHQAWELVGGIFGIHIGGFFAGESMFSRPEAGGTDASKVCLVELIRHLAQRGFTLFDVQFHNPHLEQFGVREVPRDEYKRRLKEALAKRVEWAEGPSGQIAKAQNG